MTLSLKSTAIPTISAFWLFLSALILLSSGISRRQGAHQVAQKLIISGRPPKLASLVGLPALSASVMSGSLSGMALPAGLGSSAGESAVSTAGAGVASGVRGAG